MVNINFEIKPAELSVGTMPAASYWEKLDLEVLGHFFPQYPDRLAEDLEQQGYYVADLPEELVSSVQAARRTYSQIVSLDNDADGGFVSTDLRSLGLLDSYQQGSKFVRPTAPLLVATHDLLRSIAGDVTRQLGSPWRVIMSRFWETESNANRKFMYDWHTDGMPHQFFKIMVYFGRMNTDEGSLAIKVDGDTKILQSDANGTWILFKNSALFHRGVPPSKPDAIRFAAEITIARAFKYDFIPRYAGNNAHYPKYPWMTSLLNNPIADYHAHVKEQEMGDLMVTPRLSFTAKDYRQQLSSEEKSLATLICHVRELS